MSGEADQLMINEKSILDIELNHFCKDRRDRMASMFGAMRRIRLAFAAKAKEAWRPLTVGVIIEPYVTRCIGSFLYTSLCSIYTSLYIRMNLSLSLSLCVVSSSSPIHSSSSS